MNGAFLNKILRINAKHALYRADGKWYHNLKTFPGVLFDENGLIFFPTEETYFHNSIAGQRPALRVEALF